MKSFQVGDIIEAIDDHYEFTSKRCNWKGKVDTVHNNYFSATTISSSHDAYLNHTWTYLEPEHFSCSKSHNFQSLFEKLSQI